MAFEMVKEMQADGLDWGEGYRLLCQYRFKKIGHDVGAKTSQ